MKKLGLAALVSIVLMSCSGAANDGKASTDTTTFPSETKSSTDQTGMGASPDTSINSRTPANNGAPASSPASRSTTPGNNNNTGNNTSNTNSNGSNSKQ